MAFQQSEVVCLFLALAFMLPAATLFRVARVPHSLWFAAAFFLAVSASVFTVFEDAFAYDLMNLFEHISYAASAMAFATGCWLLGRTLSQARVRS